MPPTSHTAFLFQKCDHTEPGKNKKTAEYIKLIKILVVKKKKTQTKPKRLLYISITGFIKYRTIQIARASKLCSNNVLNYCESCLLFFLSEISCKQVLCSQKAVGSQPLESTFFVSQPWLQGQQTRVLLTWLE